MLDDPVFLKLSDDILAATSQDQLQDYAYELQDHYAENLPAIAHYWNKVETPYNKIISLRSFPPKIKSRC